MRAPAAVADGEGVDAGPDDVFYAFKDIAAATAIVLASGTALLFGGATVRQSACMPVDLL